MTTFFECRIRYGKMTDGGEVKKVTESYLVDAISFTEAESRIIEEMMPYNSGELTVVAIKKTKITELFADDTAERWWMVKVYFVTVDEKSGKEKRSPSYILVQADDSGEAQQRFIAGMKDTMSDYEIGGIYETPYFDVFRHKE